MIGRSHRILAVMVVVCVQMMLNPRAGEAQSTTAYRGLFGQRERTSKRPSSIDFSMSLIDGYDSGGDQLTAANDLAARRGGYSNLDAALRYARIRRQRRLKLDISNSLRYQAELRQVLVSNYQASAAFDGPLWRSGHLDLNQSFAYTPYYQLELFPALAVDVTQPPQAPSNDYAITKQSMTATMTTIGLTQNVNRRSSLEFGYERRMSTIGEAAGGLTTQNVSVRLSHRAKRFTVWHIGGDTNVAEYGLNGHTNRTQMQELQFGLDYSRRRTSIAVSSGSSFISQSGRSYYRMTGNAVLKVEMSRKWTANARYNRSLRFVEALSYPFFADAFSMGVVGQPAKRLSAGMSVGYSTGEVGVSREGGTYGTYTGSLQMTVPVTRHYALYSEYLYYHYQFTEQAVAGFLPPRLGRHTVRVGLKLWFPVLN
jgi:hypothetical protein